MKKILKYKKLIGIIVTLMFVALLATAICFSNSGSVTAPKAPSSEYRLKDIRGVNPVDIAPDDAYKSPRETYIYIESFIKFVKEGISDKFRITQEENHNEDNNEYTAIFISKLTNTEYDIDIIGSGRYLKEFIVSTTDFDDDAVISEYTELCKIFTDILEDSDALNLKDKLLETDPYSPDDRFFAGKNWLFEIDSSKYDSDEEEDDEEDDEPDEEYKSLIPHMTSHSKAINTNYQTLYSSRQRINYVDFIATHLLLGESKYFN